MLDLPVGHNFEGSQLVEGVENVPTDEVLLLTKEHCLLSWHSLHVPVEVIEDLALDAHQFAHFVNLCLLKQALVLTENRLDCSCEDVWF